MNRILVMVAAALIAAAEPAENIPLEPSVFSDPPLESVTAESAAETLARMPPFIQLYPVYRLPDGVNKEAFDEAWAAETRRLAKHRCQLVAKLAELVPDHKKLPQLMAERIELIGGHLINQPDQALAIADAVIADAPDSALAREARYAKASMKLGDLLRAPPDQRTDARRDRALEALDEFASRHPDDQRAAGLLMSIAFTVRGQPEREIPVLRRVAIDYTETEWSTIAIGRIRQLESIGHPFELEFDDAITGRRVSMRDLRGKVVVIDFWASWCGPCVAELPKLKSIYEQHRGRGVEFIGVSLDNHVEALRKKVAELEVPWPQVWEERVIEPGPPGSRFTREWGIHAIPVVFVVDQDGRLRSTDARGKVEEWIETLLAERSPPG